MSSQAVTVFFSYSHKDKALRDELAKHLESLKFSEIITDWHDGEILPGDEWDREIQSELNSAQIILLLVSADFIGSRYCREVEIKQAMARHEAGEARVIPIILRKCFWHVTPFGKLQALPKNGTPVMDAGTWATWDDAFYSITEGIHRAAGSFAQQVERKPVASVTEVPTMISVEDCAANARAQYREQVEEYLAEHELTEIHEIRLEILRKQLKLSAVEAQQILSEVLAPLEQNREMYRDALSGLVEKGRNPQDVEIKQELAQIKRELALTDEEVAEIEQPILAAADYKFEIEGSERGIDYSKLRDLLKAGEWEAADRETYEVMIRVVGKKSGNSFSVDDLLNFPCGDLRIIDRLWVKYSNGRFGISVQKKIYVECGAALDGKYPGNAIFWSAFCDRIGWQKNGKWVSREDLIFSTNAPQGHLPRACEMVYEGWGVSLFSHRDL